MKILVTGGAGFIGSHFVRTLLSGGYPPFANSSVVVLDKLTYAGNLANLDPVREHPRLAFVEGDILDVQLVDSLVDDVDAVVHFAAESHVDRSIAGAADFVLTNVAGTQTMLDASLRHGVDRFLHVSTDEVYGSIERGSWPETHPLEPNSPYSASKASSDLIARSYGRTHGLDVVITRCSNNYGPYQFPEKVIPLFVTNLMDGLPLPLYGDGLNVRDWLHVDDHCRGIALVLDKDAAARSTTSVVGRSCRIASSPNSYSPRVTPVGSRSSSSRIARVTIGATRSTSRRSPQSWAMRRPCHSVTDSGRRCAGIATTGAGGSH